MFTRMATKATEQRNLYRRLRAAGCRLDYDNLPPFPSPLRVSSPTWPWPTHIFPIVPGTIVMVPIRIVALQPRTICHWSLAGEWFPGSERFLQRCPEVKCEACFRDEGGTHYHLRTNPILNNRLLGSVFRRGMHREGYLALIFPPLSSSAKAAPEVTLEITDEFEDTYLFDFNLTFDPAAAAETSARLVTTHRAPEETAPTPTKTPPDSLACL